MFQLQARGSTWPRELLAGITVFFTASYILFLIPPLLQKAGLPADHGAALVALVAGVGTIAMGLFANLPFILAPGVGMAAYFVFGGVFDMGLTWQAVMTGAFVASLTIAVLTLLGLRDFLVDAFPTSVKLAAMSGVGLFLTFIGFQNAGLVVDSPATLVALGSMKSPSVLLTFFGIIFTGVLMARRVPAAILLGILATTALALVLGVATLPPLAALVAMPTLPAFDASQLQLDVLTQTAVWSVIVGFFFLSLLDSAGSFCALGRLGGLVDEDNRVFGATKTYFWNSLGGAFSGAAGTSPSTTFIESAVALQAGGRTGLTAIVAGLLFLGAMFCVPLLGAIPAVATAPALIITGAMMMRGITDMEWTEIEDNIPAFLTLASMAFTFNIAHGIALGIIAHNLIYLFSSRREELTLSSMVLTAILGMYLAVYL